jgi:hypothetical protein
MANDYTLNWSSNALKSPLTLAGGTQDSTSTSLTLTGKGSINWGEPLQENLLKLLENFASTTEPAHATTGQLWFNPTTQTVFLCYSVDGFGVPSWTQIYSISNITLAAAPSSPTVGQLWFDTNTVVLKHWSGSAWTPIYSSTSLTSETEPSSPATGQLWYKSSTKRMSIYNGTTWVYLFSGDSISSATAPTSPVRGTLWFDTGSNTLKIYDNTNVFVPVSNSANIVFDGTYYILNAPLKVSGLVIADGFVSNAESTFTFSSTQTINYNLRNLYAGTLTGNSIVTLSGSWPGHFQLRVIQDATGGRTITWQNIAGWLGAASAPPLASGANAVTFINFFRTGTGLWYGQLIKVGA